MRFALSVPPFTDPRDVVDWAVAAESNGWDGFFLWDHLRWDDRVETHDPWSLLGAIAVRTTRIRIGTMVTPLSRRRPWVVAKHLTTLDHLSGGRVTLGVGLGEPPDHDFAELGDESSPVVRAAMLDEGLTVLAGLIGEGRVEFHGDHYDVDASVRPLPLQRPRIPIWVAGIAPHSRPLVRARKWDGFIPISDDFLTPEQLASYVGDHPRPGWDVAAQRAPGVPVDELAGAGATWLVSSTWPHMQGWREEVGALAASSPEQLPA